MLPYMILGKTLVLIVLLLVAYQFYRGFKKSVARVRTSGGVHGPRFG